MPSPVSAVADPARFEARTWARSASGARFGLAAPMGDRVVISVFVLALTPHLPPTNAHVVLEASAWAFGAREGVPFDWWCASSGAADVVREFMAAQTFAFSGFDSTANRVSWFTHFAAPYYLYF